MITMHVCSVRRYKQTLRQHALAHTVNHFQTGHECHPERIEMIGKFRLKVVYKHDSPVHSLFNMVHQVSEW